VKRAALILALISGPAAAQQTPYNWNLPDNVQHNNQILHDFRTTNQLYVTPRGQLRSCRTQHLGRGQSITQCY
jgi:hypothetical protein